MVMHDPFYAIIVLTVDMFSAGVVQMCHDGSRARFGRSSRCVLIIIPQNKQGTTQVIFTLLAVGDIAPREGIPKAEKRRLEAVCPSSFLPSYLPSFPTLLPRIDKPIWPAQEAMQNLVHEMLHDSPAALKIMSLWKEYEDQSTAEARFVKGRY